MPVSLPGEAFHGGHGNRCCSYCGKGRIAPDLPYYEQGDVDGADFNIGRKMCSKDMLPEDFQDDGKSGGRYACYPRNARVEDGFYDRPSTVKIVGNF